MHLRTRSLALVHLNDYKTDYLTYYLSDYPFAKIFCWEQKCTSTHYVLFMHHNLKNDSCLEISFQVLTANS